MQTKGAVRYRPSSGPESPLALGIDFRFARRPQVHTYADCVSVENDEEIGIATMLFGQAAREGPGECVRIATPSVALFRQFLPSAKAVEDTLPGQLKTLKLESASRPVSSAAIVQATRFANVIFVATALGEGALDFYYVPGRDIHFARLHRSEIELEPIIRVIVPLPVLQYFFQLCRQQRQPGDAASPGL